MDARPRPILRTLCPPRLHRVQVNQALRRKPCCLRRSWIAPPQQANSEAVRIPRQGKTRQVIKNQLPDTTQRRSRDIAPGIILKPVNATRHFSMSSIPHGIPQSNFSRRKITLRYAAQQSNTHNMRRLRAIFTASRSLVSGVGLGILHVLWVARCDPERHSLYRGRAGQERQSVRCL